MKKFKYHYFYKITNLINGNFYYGIHSTNNINDGYMGSGSRLHTAYKIFGKENFIKDILKYFSSREDASIYESMIVNEQLVHEEKCYNLKIGGDYGTCIDTVLVIDDKGKWIRCLTNDEKYLNGEYKHFLTNMIPVFNKHTLCYELVEKEIYYENKNDYIAAASGKLVVKDKNNNTLQVSLKDERYLNGELIPLWKGMKHTNETIEKMKKTHKINEHQKGEKNSQFGTCWINNGEENKKIKTNELIQFLSDGWNKGRIIKEKIDKEKYFKIKKLYDLNLSILEISKKLSLPKSTIYRYIKKIKESKLSEC